MTKDLGVDMEENKLQEKVCYLLSIHGIYVARVGGSTRAGIPDTLVCYQGKFYALEFKTENGFLSELQNYNLKHIKKNGGIGLVIRPSNYEKILKDIFSIDGKKKITKFEPYKLVFSGFPDTTTEVLKGV